MYVFYCRSKRTACSCLSTVEAHGGHTGTYFVDFTTNHCGVKIRDIWINSGEIIDGIQVQYQLSNGDLQMMPHHGGPGGDLNVHISVPQKSKVMGIFGVIWSHGFYGTVIKQLRILVLDGNDHLQIYGPFGSEIEEHQRQSTKTFAVYGEIKSLFGYYAKHLNGLGAYYEPWGDCLSPCD